MLRKSTSILTLCLLLMITSGASAQYLWKVELSDNDWRFQNGFQVLNCKGDDCTAAGIVFDYLSHFNMMMFWHSTDCGINWNIQNPHLPYFHDAAGNTNLFIQVQQIDSLNIVAIGKYQVMLHSFNGGETWIKQDCNTYTELLSVHFSDPMTGIFTCNDMANPVFATSDGGMHWKSVGIDFQQRYFSTCHSFGSGKFSVLGFIRGTGIGSVLTTRDNWKTVQESKSIVDSVHTPNWQNYFFNSCRFHGMDTIIAYGYFMDSIYHALISRTIDGGLSWEKPYVSRIDTTKHGYFWAGIVNNMTEIYNDTVIAATFDLPKLLLSTNAGKSWNENQWQLDTSYGITESTGLSWTSNGPVVIVGSGLIDLASLILKGTITRSFVPEQIIRDKGIRIFPNPAQTEVQIRSDIPLHSVSLYDMLGREIRNKLTFGTKNISFDLHGLSPGFYTMSTGDHQKLGKLMIRDE